MGYILYPHNYMAGKKRFPKARKCLRLQSCACVTVRCLVMEGHMHADVTMEEDHFICGKNCDCLSSKFWVQVWSEVSSEF